MDRYEVTLPAASASASSLSADSTTATDEFRMVAIDHLSKNDPLKDQGGERRGGLKGGDQQKPMFWLARSRSGRDRSAHNQIGFPPLPKQVELVPESSVGEMKEKEMKSFELMNVRLAIYGISGIVCERVEGRKKRFEKKGFAAGNDMKSSSSSNNASTTSSITSAGGFPWNDVINFEQSSSVPTTAVLSCEKNTIGSQTSVQTYLPSMPLQQPVAILSNKAHYSASWPLERSSLERDDSANELSSFQIIRCMESAGYVAGKEGGASFLTQHVELNVSISRGTDIFPLGSARVAFSGDEEQETIMYVPVQAVQSKQGKFLKKKKTLRTNFASDPTLKWSLEENASVRVGIKVIPQKTIDFGEERETKKREDELRQILHRDDVATLLLHMGSSSLDPTELLHQRKSAALPEEHGDSTKDKPSLVGILCGALPALCAPSVLKPEPSQIPSMIGELQLNSIMSSVSESTDGTDHECDDD